MEIYRKHKPLETICSQVLMIVIVTDTGDGIAPENLAKLMQRGMSIGKKNGQGLGLFHARESVESWGGKIEIESKVEGVTGTTVTITLPRQTEPDWFVPEIIMYEGARVIILGDDDSIHQIWKGRFEAFKAVVNLHHFPNGALLGAWYKQQSKHKGQTVVLCDYEIIGSDESGLDVIKALGLEDQTILVTSRYEEKNVREECARLEIKLLPKNLASFMPIRVIEIPDNLEFVLIDDNRMNRKTWEIMAKRNKKKIITFERPNDFYDVAERINRDAKLYVDLNLGRGINGKDVTREINAKGFSKIYLYTGENSVDISDMPWIKGVVGKGVPFGEDP